MSTRQSSTSMILKVYIFSPSCFLSLSLSFFISNSLYSAPANFSSLFTSSKTLSLFFLSPYTPFHFPSHSLTPHHSPPPLPIPLLISPVFPSLVNCLILTPLSSILPSYSLPIPFPHSLFLLFLLFKNPLNLNFLPSLSFLSQSHVILSLFVPLSIGLLFSLVLSPSFLSSLLLRLHNPSLVLSLFLSLPGFSQDTNKQK